MIKSQKPSICKEHNQPIFTYREGQFLCEVCINQQPEFMSIGQFLSQLRKLSLKQNQEFEQQHQLLQSLLDSLLQYRANINMYLEKIVQLIIEQIATTKLQKQYFQSQISKSNNQQKLIGELKEEFVQTTQSNKSVRSLIESLLLDFKQKLSNIDPIIGMLKQNSIQDIQANDMAIYEKDQIQDMQGEHQNVSNNFEYLIINENRMKKIYSCQTIAFNRNGNILIVGAQKCIIIYQFDNEKISKELLRLSCHTEDVSILYIMKESNKFISGSKDNTMIIWVLNKSYYFEQQILIGHQDTINCLQMNKEEDLLISGSDDRTIKFWRAQEGRWYCEQTIETYYFVYDLSMNEMRNKLISCGGWNDIVVYEIQLSDQQWGVVQIIETTEWGKRLCFTIGDQFVFQPETEDYLEIYDYDRFKKQFYKLKQVLIQSCKSCCVGFPCQFIQQFNIITVKHGNNLNIFRVGQDGNYQLIQTIEFNDFHLCGRMTDNGQYLATWDFESQEIKIRNLIQMK